MGADSDTHARSAQSPTLNIARVFQSRMEPDLLSRTVSGELGQNLGHMNAAEVLAFFARWSADLEPGTVRRTVFLA
jgi:hypothetical protein